MKRLRLRTILLTVNLFVLIVPLVGIYTFRIYENQLVRQVESELIAQGAYASAFYKAALHQQQGAMACSSANDPAAMSTVSDIEPILNLAADPILATRPDALAATQPVDAVAEAAGRAAYPVLAQASSVTFAGFRIVDCHGIVVAGKNELGQSLANVPELRGALDGHYRAALRVRTTDNPHPPLASISRGADIRVFVAMPIRDDGRIVGAILLSRTPRDIAESLYDERRAVISAGAIVLVLTCLLALLTSRAIGRPIAALQEQAQRIGRGDKDVQPLARPVTLEVAELSDSLTAMGQTLGRRSTYIRDFATHMSHEFKTPLTSIQGALELIFEHRAGMDDSQLQRFLTNAIKDAERLKLLVGRLLELARADMMEADNKSCDLMEIIERVKSYHPSTSINLVVEPDLSPHLVMSADIAQAVVTTLFTNSAQHGATKITVTMTAVKEGIQISIKDNGSGISPANVEKLFVPFFTTKRDTGGTGLGLVIVRSMLEAYGGTIHYRPDANGTNFVIVFPEKSFES